MPGSVSGVGLFNSTPKCSTLQSVLCSCFSVVVRRFPFFPSLVCLSAGTCWRACLARLSM